MNRFERVVEILDAAVGGPSALVRAHGPFWRAATRNQFVALRIRGLQLVSIGNGVGSNLIKALKGEPPFGADLPGAPEDATIDRMPAGLDPVPPEQIAFIQTWIDEGCLEDPLTATAALSWRRTNAPIASSRTDDIWFLDPNTGWAVNSDGNILNTTDGGRNWSTLHSLPSTYLRCIAFANASVGWVGSLSAPINRLLQTRDGGMTWTRVSPHPPHAPVAVCGLAVVNEFVVYASGTNRPRDRPGMMKTVDGGQTWTARDMSAHASILIDTYFTDAMHGWVVGGKADAPTPGNPNDRSRIKPVVLETSDGGATWINRLAGQEAQFPFGEWGWKIQFLDARTGFVSLENFTDGAILKTTDGGASWTRHRVNDAQANANLEGIGFIDANRGWVGGWGRDFPADGSLPPGFSSATSDGGANWQDANSIGKLLNRFRFFGRPVTVGYASGDTIYKYSAEPVPAARFAAVAPSRPLIAAVEAASAGQRTPIALEIPDGTKRLTIYLWDRFGDEVGCLLDELEPRAGARTLAWDGLDSKGQTVSPGYYILRVIADDLVASRNLTYAGPGHGAAPSASATRPSSRRPRPAMAEGRERRTLAAIMQRPAPARRDLAWLQEALQLAIDLELATLPPYLTAYWTIQDVLHPAAESIAEIWREEMLHFGLACNLLVAIGGTPRFADAGLVPRYPGPLPGGVRPGLQVALRRLNSDQARVFMEIEYPQAGPMATLAAEPPETIGAFYASILASFEALNPALDTRRQLSGPLRLFKIDDMSKVKQAIDLINLQGEGSNVSPEEGTDDLAHYYRFGEIHHGRRLVRDATTGKWSFSGASLEPIATWPMADIPDGGYLHKDVPDMAAWDLIAVFDQQYSQMLRALQSAWENGSTLRDAIGHMREMAETATRLVQIAKPDGSGNYGPCFRYVP